jgi:hypothetical protein
MPPPASPETIFSACDAAIHGIRKIRRESLRNAGCGHFFQPSLWRFFVPCGDGFFNAGREKKRRHSDGAFGF